MSATVSDLIDYLQQFDPSWRVVLEGQGDEAESGPYVALDIAIEQIESRTDSELSPELSPYEQWMVRSNLATIRNEGVSVERQVAILRANGYPQVAAAVELAHREAPDA